MTRGTHGDSNVSLESSRRFGGVFHDPGMSQDSLNGKSVHGVVFQKPVDQISSALAHVGRIRELHLQHSGNSQAVPQGVVELHKEYLSDSLCRYPRAVW